ncbi:MAG TPA: ATP-binding protein [Kofleriaceae bacterium]|nr:ATP-binding protein [Kofleriaceae bacterium]
MPEEASPGDDGDALPRTVDAGERALTGRLAKIEGERDQIATEALRPTALMVGVVFIVFTIQNWVSYPPEARATVVPYNVGLVVLGFTLYAVCRRITLSSRGSHIAATGLAFAVLGQILLTTLYGLNPLFTHFVSILLIASAGSIMATGWVVLIAGVAIAAWAVVAGRVLSTEQLGLNYLVMMTSAGVAVVVHIGRRLSRARVLELRAGDARRELALKRALAEADEVRRELDRKVEERTAALRNELEERVRLEEQLRHAQKLEAVGRLAGGIAHDFNNLLTVIRMSHTTFAGADTSPDELRSALRDASEATDRAASLTYDLLAFARKQTLQRAQVAISDILGGVERMVRRVAEASIRIEVRAAAEAGEVVADRHQIEQVLLNLAINACDAMGNRGTLTIAADVVELSGAAAARHRVRSGHWVRIAVTDTGTGMDEATQRSVFEPFFTTKGVGQGTGLGLAVAHGIVTQHGGQIEVASELGVGSTFTVLLPRARGTTQRNAVVTAQPVAARASETVLVVEDEAAVRSAVRRNLERLGYRVMAAHDGEDALRCAEELDGIDLLLTDVVMPGIDGPDLACRLREKWPELPVLFVTGYSADRLERTGAVGPRDRVMEKPYHLAELTRTIRQMLEARSAARA